MTQEQAASLAGLDVRHLQKLERAEVAATLDTLDALAAGLGLEVRLRFPRRRR